MSAAQRFRYVEIAPTLGAASALPYAPITLNFGGKTASTTALIDSGAALNVLPYDVGIELGMVWERQSISMQLAGNLANSEAKATIVNATIGQFAPVRLAFAWTRNNHVPVILGQVNFFLEFDVCFFRSQSAFEIKPQALSS